MISKMQQQIIEWRRAKVMELLSKGTLDKEATSYNDIFDAFRLALKFYHFKERND
jgi:hypothetical protein